MLKLGLIINPFAGIGGKVGLKGSDGEQIRSEAFARGAKPQAVERTELALEVLLQYREQITWLTASGDMGADLLQHQGFNYSIVYDYKFPSTQQDTIEAASAMINEQVDLLVFAGGDGTARNIYHAISDVEDELAQTPVLGIPAGVKIHSGVYAVTPRAAGRVIEKILNNQLVALLEASVMDIDEVAFRQGTVKAKLYGQMQVPAQERYIQATKSGTGSQESEVIVAQEIAEYLVEELDEDGHYLIGSGTTCAALMDELNLPNTLLGIDWIHQNQVQQSDLNEAQILAILNKHPNNVKAIITIIGGQGHIIGRGNQQLSANVLQKLGKDNLIIIATKAKLSALAGKPLIVDSDNPKINRDFSGSIKVVVGYQDMVLYHIEDIN